MPAHGDAFRQIARGETCSLRATTVETRAVFTRYWTSASATRGRTRSTAEAAEPFNPLARSSHVKTVEEA